MFLAKKQMDAKFMLFCVVCGYKVIKNNCRFSHAAQKTMFLVKLKINLIKRSTLTRRILLL